MTLTREQQIERQMREMEYVEAFQEAAHNKGLYMDHTSGNWEKVNGSKDGTKKLTFFIWDAAGSISRSFRADYTNVKWAGRKQIVPFIIEREINEAFNL